MSLHFHQTNMRMQSKAAHRFVRGMLLLLVCVFGAGCQRWPGSQQARQFQIDSDRLLGEFRAQKKRADELASKNQLLEERLAESEKILARQNLVGNRSKSSSSSGGSRLMIGDSPESDSKLSRNNSSRSTGSSRFEDFERGGLPDRTPGTTGVFASSRDDQDLVGDPNRSPQWRPINKR